MLYEDLVQNFNAVCEKCNKAIARANDEISKRGCLEIELADLRHELRTVYAELSELKSKKKATKK